MKKFRSRFNLFLSQEMVVRFSALLNAHKQIRRSTLVRMAIELGITILEQNETLLKQNTVVKKPKRLKKENAKKPEDLHLGDSEARTTGTGTP